MVKTIRHITARITALLVMALFFCMMCGFDSTAQKVYDDAGLLTSDQINRLEALCVSKAETSQIDLIIVTTDSTKGRSSMRYAEDFYMAHDFGYDKLHGDGALMLIKNVRYGYLHQARPSAICLTHVLTTSSLP
mgnify:CR=1 FL=1